MWKEQVVRSECKLKVQVKSAVIRFLIQTPLFWVSLPSFLTRIAASSGAMPNEWPQRPPLCLQLERAAPLLEPQNSDF